MQQEGVKYRISLEDFFSNPIHTAESNALGFERRIDSIGDHLSGLKSQLAAAFGAFQLFNFGSSAIDVGSRYEAAEIGLSTLLKSATQAHDVMEQVKQDAMTTPFGVEALLLANKSLISAGVNSRQAREDVLNLANAISATGGGNDELTRMVVNMQQIKNTGKATAIDIKQFAYAGINIYGALAASLGKTTEQVKDMEVNYTQLTNALRIAREDGGIYEKGLEKMAGSTAVMKSNLSDLWDAFKNDVFLEFKDDITNAIKATAEFIQWLRRNIDTIKAFAAGIAAAAVAYKVLAVGMSIHNAFLIAQKAATIEMTVAQWAMNAALHASPIGLIALGLGAAAAAVYGYTESIRDYKDAVDSQKLTSDESKNAISNELVYLKQKTEELQKQKNISESLAFNQAVASTKSKLHADYYDAQKKYNEAWSNEDNKKFAEQGKRMNVIALQLKELDKTDLFKNVKATTVPGGKTTAPDLGSGISEPKASKIQNITFNLNNPFQNQRITMGGGDMDVKDIAPKFTEYLISLVQDAAIVAHD